MRVVLASGSPQRLALLRGIGIEPLVMPGAYEELRVAGESPEDMVLRLAEGKARAALARGDVPAQALLVAADTVVVIDGDILGKARDPEDAARMLRRLRGREHRVLTGLALLARNAPRGERGAEDGANLRFDLSLAETKVRFRNFDDAEIRAYLEREDVLGAAGSYRVQSLGALLLESIEGTWSNIVGLPLEMLAARARGLGVCLLSERL